MSRRKFNVEIFKYLLKDFEEVSSNFYELCITYILMRGGEIFYYAIKGLYIAL